MEGMLARPDRGGVQRAGKREQKERDSMRRNLIVISLAAAACAHQASPPKATPPTDTPKPHQPAPEPPVAIASSDPADDPFAGDTDSLAIGDEDGSTSVRAKKRIERLSPDMVTVRVVGVDDTDFPHCTFAARVIKAPKGRARHLKLVGQGKVYRFAPQLKRAAGGVVDLTDPKTRSNLGACYFPEETTLVVSLSGIDRKAKRFMVSEIFPK